MAQKQKTKQKTGSKNAAASGQSTKPKQRSDHKTVVRERIKKLIQTVEESYIELTEQLSEAYHSKYWQDWGFEEFKAYCEGELGTHYRKAMYYVEIGDKIKALELPKDRVKALGWTKMKDLAAVITAENWRRWFDRAEGMSSRELTDQVKITRRTDTRGAELPKITTIKLVMSEAEASVILDAIDEAKKIGDMLSPVSALELICQEWQEEKGVQPQRRSLSASISYLERTFGVRLQAVEAGAAATEKPVEKAAEKPAAEKPKTKEKEKAAEKPKATNGKKGASIDDLIGEGEKNNAKAEEKAAEKKEKAAPKATQSVDEMLGL